MITREQIEAFINTLEIQRHNCEQQLTMTNGALDALRHLLSLPQDEKEESELKHGD